MPMVKFYRGVPVKHMRRAPGDNDRILLTLYSRESGKPGRQLTVTQADWTRDGTVQTDPKYTADVLRSMVPVK